MHSVLIYLFICFGQFVLVLLTLTFLSFYSLLLYFYMLAASALSLAPREDWTLINLSRAFRAQDGVWSGVDRFWVFLLFASKTVFSCRWKNSVLYLQSCRERLPLKPRNRQKQFGSATCAWDKRTASITDIYGVTWTRKDPLTSTRWTA